MRKVFAFLFLITSGLAFANPPGTFQPLLLAGGPQGPVTFDAKGTANCYAASATSVTCSTLTVGTGAKRALAVTLVWSSLPSAVSCTWDSGGSNQVMTQISLQSNTRAAALFGLVNPVSGAKTLSCSWTGTVTDTFVAGISFNNVDQTGGTTTFYNATSTSGSGGTQTVTVTSATTDAAVNATGGLPLTSTPSQTSLFIDNTHGSVINAGASYNVGSASAVFGWSPATEAAWINIGVALKNG